MSNKLQALLDNQDWVLSDGATGTNLFALGLKQGDPPELWNLDFPERIIQHHLAFIEAGAQILLTNSFGGTRNRLKLHKGLEQQCFELNKRAAELAHEAIKQSGKTDIIIAGSMGPTGDLYEPIGPLSIADGTESYTEQAKALAEGGADVLWIETLSSLEEIDAAVKGAETTGLPIALTMSFDSNGRTMMGLDPRQFADAMRGISNNLIAFGANCGNGTADLMAALHDIRGQENANDVLIAKSNAGVPEFIDGDFVYSGTPELMAQYACMARDLGVKIIGGCCGTTPEHLAKMREALESTPAASRPSLDMIVEQLGALSGNQLEAAAAGSPSSSQRRGRRGRRKA